jgi:hypothetical protein
MEKHINKILWIVAISFMLIAGCASAFGQINFTLKRVTLDSINGRIANIHMNDSVIFHAGTNIEGGSYNRDSVYQYIIDSLIYSKLPAWTTDDMILSSQNDTIYGDVNIKYDPSGYGTTGELTVPGIKISTIQPISSSVNLTTGNLLVTGSNKYISIGNNSPTNSRFIVESADSSGYYNYFTVLKDSTVVGDAVYGNYDLKIHGDISADNLERHTTKFDWDYTDGIYFQNKKLNGKYIIVTSVMLREITQLSSTSGTTTVTVIDEGSSGVTWASIIADGTGALELTNETIQTYPVYVNDNGIVENFTFVGSVDDLTGGSLSVYIEYIEFDL